LRKTDHADIDVDQRDQTTIPKKIRGHLHLRPGDRLEFITEADSRVVLVPVTLEMGDLFGALPNPERKVSIEEMSQTIREAASETRKR
jgi:AbrB family looped-hinge helix DNA binding protein